MMPPLAGYNAPYGGPCATARPSASPRTLPHGVARQTASVWWEVRMMRGTLTLSFYEIDEFRCVFCGDVSGGVSSGGPPRRAALRESRGTRGDRFVYESGPADGSGPPGDRVLGPYGPPVGVEPPLADIVFLHPGRPGAGRIPSVVGFAAPQPGGEFSSSWWRSGRLWQGSSSSSRPTSWPAHPGDWSTPGAISCVLFLFRHHASLETWGHDLPEGISRGG